MCSRIFSEPLQTTYTDLELSALEEILNMIPEIELSGDDMWPIFCTEPNQLY